MAELTPMINIAADSKKTFYPLPVTAAGLKEDASYRGIVFCWSRLFITKISAFLFPVIEIKRYSECCYQYSQQGVNNRLTVCHIVGNIAV
jgi:hypothetical protein